MQIIRYNTDRDLIRNELNLNNYSVINLLEKLNFNYFELKIDNIVLFFNSENIKCSIIIKPMNDKFVLIDYSNLNYLYDMKIKFYEQVNTLTESELIERLQQIILNKSK
jgi:hypothetical protein